MSTTKLEIAPRPGLRLYEMPGIMSDLSATLDMLPDDIAYDEARAVIAAQMDAAQDTLEDKLAACAYALRNLDAETNACLEEAGRMTRRAVASQNRHDHLKAYVKSTMEALGQLKVDCGPGRPRLSVQNNGGIRAMKIDEAKLPEWFFSAFEKAKRLRGEADGIESENKSVLRAKLEAGEAVAGATLAERGSHLVIR